MAAEKEMPMTIRNLTLIAEVLTLMMFTQVSQALSVSPEEMTEARHWAAAKFEGVTESALSPQVGLSVLANHDPVQLNARAGKPLNISGKQFTRGLYCHAVSKVVVTLPGPGKRFTALVGVDSNEQTSGGRGSVVFSVSVNGKKAFDSGVLREGMPAVAVSVELGDATQFILEVSDGGDGNSCDQSDWADAQVTLADGRELWLGDTPLAQGPVRSPFSTDPPFSFVYDGRQSSDLLKEWKLDRTSEKIDSSRTRRTTTYTDPKTGLQVRCVSVEYADFPTVEWTVYFKNTGSADTPILSDIRGIDARFERGAGGEFVLHHSKGTFVRADDFEPLRTVMEPRSKQRFAPPAGRPCGTVWPYFNVEWSGGGVIVVVGWPGQWSAEFERDDTNGLRVLAGQELTHFKLRPGEEARTPLTVLQFWQGDYTRSQNIWRRWMIAHNVPRQGGKLPPPQLTPCSSHQYGEMVNADEASQKLFIDRYIEEGMKPDYWWMDAGWYVCNGSWVNTGTWEVDKGRFPKGLRAITDYGHSKDVRSLVWFEPERVRPNTDLWDKHQDWLLRIRASSDSALLNLGSPQAWKWLVEHIDGLIVSEGIDLYRQDYNIDPLQFWRENDAADRQGMTEMGYVTGYLAYWDELRKRHPNMLIDSCASGGHRNDLETMRRSLPLLRSDYIFEPIGQQGHTYGLSPWIPWFGTGTIGTKPYEITSTMCSGMIACWDLRDKGLDYALLRRMIEQWRTIAPNFVGDFYPLTPYSLATDVWIAWQYDRPEVGEGIVQAFRRSDSVYETARFKLQGLDPNATYQAKDLNTGHSEETSGKELMEKGLAVTLTDQPGAAVLTYKRVR